MTSKELRHKIEDFCNQNNWELASFESIKYSSDEVLKFEFRRK